MPRKSIDQRIQSSGLSDGEKTRLLAIIQELRQQKNENERKTAINTLIQLLIASHNLPLLRWMNPAFHDFNNKLDSHELDNTLRQNDSHQVLISDNELGDVLNSAQLSIADKNKIIKAWSGKAQMNLGYQHPSWGTAGLMIFKVKDKETMNQIQNFLVENADMLAQHQLEVVDETPAQGSKQREAPRVISLYWREQSQPFNHAHLHREANRKNHHPSMISQNTMPSTVENAPRIPLVAFSGLGVYINGNQSNSEIMGQTLRIVNNVLLQVATLMHRNLTNLITATSGFTSAPSAIWLLQEISEVNLNYYRHPGSIQDNNFHLLQ